jgi:WD40 repeat protein
VRGAAAVAAKVNDVIKLVADEDAVFTDPELAGRRLGALLESGPRRLLVLDDVWEPEQLAPFVDGGQRCARLVTTRVPRLLASQSVSVRVDQMSPAQARALLTAGLPPLAPALVGQLLAVTGRWPLLLRLANKILANAAQAGAEVPTVGGQLLERLQAGGPAVIDDLSGEASRVLDVGKPQERARAVRATIEASTSMLNPHDAQRFAELGVFAADETIPFALVARLWGVTGGLDELQSSQLAIQLSELALVSLADDGSGGLALHDVVRDFVRGDLGRQRLADLSGALVDAVAAGLPASDAPQAPETTPARAWWELGRSDRYMRDHLIEHLLDADRQSDAEAVAGDLRWVGARLQASGPATPASDLAIVGTSKTARLQAVLARAAHLLAPTEPAESVIDVLHSRVAEDPDWGAQAIALRNRCHRPRLVNRSPLPDLPHPALRRVILTNRDNWVNAVAISSDGSWLAAGGDDGKVRIWDAVTGHESAALACSHSGVRAISIAPDGSWLATGDYDGTVRIWDATTGHERASFKSHQGLVRAVSIAPDGSWLATGGGDGTVLIWDIATGQERAALTAPYGSVRAVAIAPDGSWLATGGEEHGEVRIRDLATGHERAALAGHYDRVNSVAISQDGSWLATGSDDETVRIWDATTWQERATLTSHHGRVKAVAISQDGSWLATGSDDGTVRIWDATTWQERANLATRHGWVCTVAIVPDGSWLATGGTDGTVRIWDAAAGQERSFLTSHHGRVNVVAIAPDGRWLATGGEEDGTVRIWDTGTWQQRANLTSHHRWVHVVAISPDGSWLATGGAEDGTVRIWDTGTWQQRAILISHHRWVHVVAISPDGSWLATVSAEDGTVRIWDTGTWQQCATLTSHDGLVRAVAIAPDGRWLATGGEEDGTVRIWDTGTWQQCATLTSHHGPVNLMAISPDGSWLATVSGDKTVRICDAATGKARALMRVESMILACAWISNGGLALGGMVGLYLFDFLVDGCGSAGVS